MIFENLKATLTLLGEVETADEPILLQKEDFEPVAITFLKPNKATTKFVKEMVRGGNRHILLVSSNEPEMHRNERHRHRSRPEMPGLSRIQTVDGEFIRGRTFLPGDTASTSEHAMLLNHDGPENYGSVNVEIVDSDSASDSQLSSLPQYSECARDKPPEYSSGCRRFFRGLFRIARDWGTRRAVDGAALESAITVEEQFVNARLVKTSCSCSRHHARQSLRRHRSQYPNAWSEKLLMSEIELDTRGAIAFMMGFALLMSVLAIVVGGVVFFGGLSGV